ncbi:hypothetical protein FALCPG4_008716 [Fusarium falciforme]
MFESTDHPFLATSSTPTLHVTMQSITSPPVTVWVRHGSLSISTPGILWVVSLIKAKSGNENLLDVATVNQLAFCIMEVNVRELQDIDKELVAPGDLRCNTLASTCLLESIRGALAVALDGTRILSHTLGGRLINQTDRKVQ